MPSLLTVLPLLIGCGSDSGSVPVADGVRVLDRASMALRGVHASDAEVERVSADPAALREVVRSWMTDPRFGETVRDLHAEHIHVRWGVLDHGPSVGVLEPFDGGEIVDSLDEAPLRFIEHVVLSGRPYTDLVTTDETMANPIVALAYGLPYDEAGADWQVTRWTDGRPPGGLLVDNGWLLRYQVAPSNYHRSRGNAAAAALVCDDFSRREGLGLDIPEGGAAGVESAECQACHLAMDPLSSAFWPARGFILARETEAAEAAGCPDELAHACYPLQMWDPSLDEHEALGLPDAAWYGTPVTDLGDLGRRIADDPRFASCAAERFWSYLANIDRVDVPFEISSELASNFVAGGFDARELIIDIVTHPAWVDLVSTRPGQYARFVEDLTGYRWTGTPDAPGCSDCVGEIELARNDHFGLHTVMGGPDGWFVLESTPTPTPTAILARKWLAEEAAASVVGGDVAALPEARRLLVAADPWDTSDAAIDAQLVSLQRRILGPTADQSATVPLRRLFDEALVRHAGDPLPGWRLVIAALLLDPQAVAF